MVVIWNNNYDKYMTENEFLEKLVSNSTVKVPYSLIKFQKPKIIKTIEPRLPSVGICTHYSYAVPLQLVNWFDYHLSSGFKEIGVYDSMEDKKLTQVLKEKYGEDERISIIPYNIALNDLCDESILFDQFRNSNINFKIKEYLIKSERY